jgi:hypothetical protein
MTHLALATKIVLAVLAVFAFPLLWVMVIVPLIAKRFDVPYRIGACHSIEKSTASADGSHSGSLGFLLGDSACSFSLLKLSCFLTQLIQP